MPRVFINYRRADTPVHAAWVDEWLTTRYGKGSVFMDLDAIAPGEDFVVAIERAVAESSVMLALIGREWITDREGRRRLEEPEDYVRLEIETALKANKLVIPVRVEGAPMPDAKDLPESLRPLARRNAFEITTERYRYDRERLLARLDEVLDFSPQKERKGKRVTIEIPPDPPSDRPQETRRPPTPIAPLPKLVQPDHGPTAVTPAPVPFTPTHEPQQPQAPDRSKRVAKWGWILTAASLIVPFLAAAAIVCGALVISRSDGRRTAAGIAIIIAALVVGFLSFSYWLGRSLE